MKSECQCDKCKGACKYNPGWFLPGEAEEAARYLNLPLKKFFKKYLGIDWWEADNKTDKEIFVLAPAITNMATGKEYPGDPRGECIFFKDGLCKIHPVKPFECSEYIHGDQNVSNRHWEVAEMWKEHQSQIVELLGRKPIAAEFSGNSFEFLGGGRW